jgi:CheY-like chemotaxis protein
MDRPLVGRSILIVEDEPLIALDIQREFEAAGARVVLKRSLQSALVAVEEDAPSAAILIMRCLMATAPCFADGSKSETYRLSSIPVAAILRGHAETALWWTNLITLSCS